MSDAPIHDLTIAELGRAYRSGTLGPVQVTEHLLARIERLNGPLHAFMEITRERALAEAQAAETALRGGQDRGPLHGIPYAAKDLYDVKGLPTTAGTRFLADNIARQDCAVVSRLADAGMVLLGKTHLVQFALGIVGTNSDQGTPHNPWSETPHVPGGSSSGSGVAVGAGLAPMALGSDTGGSIRAPASLCGTVGLKTTVGRISRQGIYPLSWTLDSAGPLTRSVEDAALIHQALQGEDPRDRSTRNIPMADPLPTLDKGVKNLRLAIGEGMFLDGADPEVEAAVREAGRVLQSLGATVESMELPEAERAAATPTLRSIIVCEAVSINRKLIDAHGPELDPVVYQFLERGMGFSGEEYARALHTAGELQAGVNESLRDVDALLVPSTRLPAHPTAEVISSVEKYLSYYPSYSGNTMPGNYMNLCGVALPCGFTSGGMPIGLLVYVKAFHEEMALRVARAYEQAAGWQTRRPDLSWAG